MEHAKTPWEVGIGKRIKVGNDNIDLKYNAEHIVKCVNEYDALRTENASLVERCEELEFQLNEIRTLAKRLHEEHSLKEFYSIFNKLWKSGYHEEMSLALYTLQLYENGFDLKTWKFLKPKLKLGLIVLLIGVYLFLLQAIIARPELIEAS